MPIDPTEHINNMFADVSEFLVRFLLPAYQSFEFMPDDLVSLRERLIVEEATETSKSLETRNYEEALDGLVDLAYVALGTLYLMGATRRDVMTREDQVGIIGIINLEDGYTLTHTSKQFLVDLAYSCRESAIGLMWNFDEAWRRVHAANMTKVRAERPADSKRGSGWDIVKPVGWQKPDLSDLVKGIAR